MEKPRQALSFSYYSQCTSSSEKYTLRRHACNHAQSLCVHMTLTGVWNTLVVCKWQPRILQRHGKPKPQLSFSHYSHYTSSSVMYTWTYTWAIITYKFCVSKYTPWWNGPNEKCPELCGLSVCTNLSWIFARFSFLCSKNIICTKIQ